MADDNQLEIVMASDNNYSGILAIALYSLFQSNLSFEAIRAYVIDDHISEERKADILRIANQFGRDVIFLPTPDIPPKLKTYGSLNVSTYYRLFLTELLPDSVEKILYLDCDILVCGSLMELWRTEPGDAWIAGVQDILGRDARLSIGIEPESLYLNAGVLLVNLECWRDGNFLRLALAYLESMSWRVAFNDQGVLNHVCEGRKIAVTPECNFTRPYERFERRQLQKLIQGRCVYTEEELRKAKSAPVIVHFSGYAFSRPWFKGARGRYVEEYFRIAEESGITLQLREQPKSLKYQIRHVIDLLPDNLFIWTTNRINKAFYWKLRLKKGR